MPTRKKTSKKRTRKPAPMGKEALGITEANEANEAGEDKPKPSKAEQLRKYKERYETTVGPNGNLTMDNGDEVAVALRGSSPELVMRAAEIVKGLEHGELEVRYADRNPGARRMNAGNIIRGCVRRGEKTPKEVMAALKAASKEINAVS